MDALPPQARDGGTREPQGGDAAPDVAHLTHSTPSCELTCLCLSSGSSHVSRVGRRSALDTEAPRGPRHSVPPSTWKWAMQHRFFLASLALVLAGCADQTLVAPTAARQPSLST